MSYQVLILGATSDMAQAISKRFAKEGATLLLAGRNLNYLKAIQSDLQLRYQADVHVIHFDANDFSSHDSLLSNLPVKPNVVVVAFGYMCENEVAIENWESAQRMISSNYTGVVSILNKIAVLFKTQKAGTIVGISSVAGERGRQSNFIYGSAKAAMTAYLSGLRNYLFKYGVHVITIKPGFVRTKMIEGLATPGILTASVDQVANSVFKAVRKRQNIIYVLPIWRIVMFAIKAIPESIFKKLKL